MPMDHPTGLRDRIGLQPHGRAIWDDEFGEVFHCVAAVDEERRDTEVTQAELARQTLRGGAQRSFIGDKDGERRTGAQRSPSVGEQNRTTPARRQAPLTSAVDPDRSPCD